MATAEEIVQTKVASNAVVVFSKSACPFCAKTKQLLKDLGVTFELLELDQINDGDAIQSALEKITGKLAVGWAHFQTNCSAVERCGDVSEYCFIFAEFVASILSYPAGHFEC